MKSSLPAGFLLCLLLTAGASYGQLYEVSLDEKVQNSTLIVEGKVIEKTSFWNPAHTMIYTSNKVQVYKKFKGANAPSTIEVLTEGGLVGKDYIEASDVLSLEQGYIGVFFCYPNSVNLRSPANAVLYDVYSSSQGFLRYDLNNNKASAPFAQYDDIEGNLYALLRQKTGQEITSVDASFSAKPKKKDIAARTNVAVITSFSPATVNAGAINSPATNVLTINGSGFGPQAPGKLILFKDANNANVLPDFPVDAFSPYVISWTDNQIVVRVPQRAATGPLAVQVSAGDVGYASTDLQVFFAALSYTSGSTALEPRLMNANGLGGYSIVYSTSTAGGGTDITTDEAYNNFRRGLRTWQEVAGVNFIEAGNTTSQAVNGSDGLNIVMFDNNNKGVAVLGAGTLAICYSYYQFCSGATLAQKTGFDLVIRKDGVSTGTSNPFNKSVCVLAVNQIDLEATLAHELGHALNLGHINDPQEQFPAQPANRNPTKLMHFTVTNSVSRRSLDQSAYAGGTYTSSPQNATGYGTCLYLSEMIPLPQMITPLDECPAAFPATRTPVGTTVNVDLDHATSNRYRDPQYRAIGTAGTTTGNGVGVTNNAYYAIRTNTSGEVLFSINNYATYPAEVATVCGADQGVRVAVYQVNSCPAGQAYPAPIYVTTFPGNTNRNITGLSANTTYLFYFDGIYNTRATFDITFTGGSALPIVISNFYGKANRSTNQLFIDLEMVTGNDRMILERSADGINFKDLSPIELRQSTTRATYTYLDGSPFGGNNYYRLRTVHADGSFTYSKVVLLKNSLQGGVAIYPNPVRDQLTINLSYLPQGKYVVTITDAVGRRVYQQQSGASLVQVPFSKYASGGYLVEVMDAANNVVATQKVIAGKE